MNSQNRSNISVGYIAMNRGVRGWVYDGCRIGVERGVVGSRVTIGPMQWLYIFYSVGKTLIAEEEGLFLRMQSFHLMPRRYSLSHHIGEL